MDPAVRRPSRLPVPIFPPHDAQSYYLFSELGPPPVPFLSSALPWDMACAAHVSSRNPPTLCSGSFLGVIYTCIEKSRGLKVLM
ncbi:hypothetical protein BJY01DRAFT_202234, partial [Aspergillus pseudoustus]